MNAYEMTAVAAVIAAIAGIPSGWVVWRRAHNRSGAIMTGLAVAAAAVGIAAWLYYTRVLCPPGAGCV